MDDLLAYVNGRFIPAGELSISPIDGGFVQGTCIAEQLRTFGGVLFRLDEHLARLYHSLEVMELDPGAAPAELAAAARRVTEHNHRHLDPADDLGVSIIVTPGVYRGYSEPGPSRPLVAIHTYPLQFRLWADAYEHGQALVVSTIRQVPPECWPAAIKCRSRMHYYLADREAAHRDPQARAVLLDQQGFVTEASTANLLIFRHAEGIVSPPLEKVLRGISMATVDELAHELRIATSHRNLRPDDVAAADEVWLTSSPFCLVPVTRFDGRPIGGGHPGPIGRKLLEAWGRRVGVDLVTQARRFARR